MVWVIGILFFAGIIWLVYAAATHEQRYLRAYREAELADMAYRRQHPACTLEEAHQHRDQVNRRFGK